MANDQNASHARRPHPHRRRGSERRTHERAAPQPHADRGSRDQVDVEQIMRDIRSRVSTRHGIELTRMQVQELAARRLDTLLEPRNIAPELMEQLRRSAGERIQVPGAAPAEPLADLDEAAVYHSQNGFVRLVRRWLRPVLALLFDPAPLVDAINADRRRARAAAAREAELSTRQAQWNALHYEILQRLVTDVARASIEMQSLPMRIESLAAKLDFNERRLGEIDQAVHSGRTAVTRPQEVRQAEPAAPDAAGVPADGASEGTRRRRRRRRGRRPGLAAVEDGALGPDAERVDTEEGEIEEEEAVDAPDSDRVSSEADRDTSTTALEPAHSFSLLQPVERHPHDASGPERRAPAVGTEEARAGTGMPAPAPEPERTPAPADEPPRAADEASPPAPPPPDRGDRES
jgi:hypothetical protein